jgi:two-component system, OmpR family, response regulator
MGNQITSNINPFMKTDHAEPIFLVEDNSLYLKALEKHLKENLKNTSEIRAFSNGEECLKNMKMKPKIVVLDYFLNSASLQAMNGLDVLKQIKTTNPDTMVLMLSSQDSIKVATDTIKYGAFDYVSKNENAFIRIENAIHNIEKIVSQSMQIKNNRQARRILIAWIVLLIAVIVIQQLFFPAV